MFFSFFEENIKILHEMHRNFILVFFLHIISHVFAVFTITMIKVSLPFYYCYYELRKIKEDFLEGYCQYYLKVSSFISLCTLLLTRLLLLLKLMIINIIGISKYLYSHCWMINITDYIYIYVIEENNLFIYRLCTCTHIHISNYTMMGFFVVRIFQI